MLLLFQANYAKPRKPWKTKITLLDIISYSQHSLRVVVITTRLLNHKFNFSSGPTLNSKKRHFDHIQLQTLELCVGSKGRLEETIKATCLVVTFLTDKHGRPLLCSGSDGGMTSQHDVHVPLQPMDGVFLGFPAAAQLHHRAIFRLDLWSLLRYSNMGKQQGFPQPAACSLKCLFSAWWDVLDFLCQCSVQAPGQKLWTDNSEFL